MHVSTVAAIGAAISAQMRLQILEICDGTLAVGQIAAQLNIASPTASYHIAVLERARLVEVTRRGRRSLPRRIDDGCRLLVRALG